MNVPQTAQLPKDQQKQLHPDFVANEQAYLEMRDRLLQQYRGQWVAVDCGKVLAAGTNVLDVMLEASHCGGHPFFALVGAEDSVVFRVRRAAYSYDRSYQPFALPRLSVVFWNHSETHFCHHPDAIPDTGADVTMLPDTDCNAIDLFNSPCLLGTAAGIVGAGVTTLFYQGKVEIDGLRYAALVQAVPTGQERVIGRDVLNQQRVLFDGPAGQVVVNP